MSPAVDIDDYTFRSLEFAARVSNSTAGAIVAQLVATASIPRPMPASTGRESGEAARRVPVFAVYDGHRTHGSYDRDTTRIEISSGPLAGQSFKSPTGAAKAVIARFKPNINPNRNGWIFWLLDDGSGRTLQSIRRLV